MAQSDGDSIAVRATRLRHRRKPGQQHLSQDHQRSSKVHALRIEKRMRMTRLTLVVR
jgi:hypothetical protein